MMPTPAPARRTEADLRAALAARERLAPDIGDVLPVGRGRRHTPGPVAAIMAATAAVAAAIVVPVLVAGPDDPRPPSTPILTGPTVDEHAGDRPDLYFTVAAGSAAGYEVVPSAVAADRQVATIRAVGASTPVAVLALHRPGADAPIPASSQGADTLPTVSNTSVHGRPAHAFHGSGYNALLWDYAPRAEAVLSTGIGVSSPLPIGALVQIAEAVTFVEPYPARVPLRITGLPPSVTPTSVTVHDPGGVQAAVQFTGMDVVVTDSLPNPDWNWQPATVAGRPGECVELVDGRRCVVGYGEYRVDVGSSSAVLVEQVFAGLTLAADVGDPGTWFDVDEALPGA